MMLRVFPGLVARRFMILVVAALLACVSLIVAVPGAAMAQTVTATIPVGNIPNGVGVNPTTNKIYVANSNDHTVSVIDGSTDTVSTTIGVGVNPIGVGINPITNKIYVANLGGSNIVSVIDGITDTVTTTVTVGTQPYGVGVNPTTNKIYASNSNSNTVSVVDGTDDTVVNTIIGFSAPYGIGVNPVTNKIYVANNSGNTVSVVDGTDDTATTITGFNKPNDVCVNPTTNKIYVTNFGGSSVSVIDGATDTVIGAPITVGAYPLGVGTNSITNRIYVTNGGNAVSVIDGRNDTVTGSPITVGNSPQGIGVNPITGKIYVSNYADKTVSVIYAPPVPTTTGLSPNHQTAGEGGFTLTVNGTGFISSSVVRWNGSARTTTYVSDTQLTAAITAADIAAGGTASVTVFNPDPGGAVSNAQAFTIDPCTFYFAEGYTGAGFQEYLCLGNPGDASLEVKVTYLVKDGDPVERTYDVPALSRFTADVNTEVGPDKEVSTKCSAASAFIAERPMYFEYTGGGGSWTGGSDAVGATRTSQTWYFAEGYTGPGFDEWVCVLNPGDATAHLNFNFQTHEAGTGEIVRTGYSVGAHTRGTFKVNDVLGPGYEVSTKLTSDVPVVAERPMYFDYQGTGGWGWTGGHDVMGTPSLARDYYFAEGTTRSGFEEWLTMQNPGTSEITVNAVYQLASGVPVPKQYNIPAATRATVFVADEVGSDKDVSVHLSSASDFLSERPMYFDYQGTGGWGWTGGHCVIGAVTQGTDWFFAEGYTGEGFEEWLCIQNPGATAAHVSITYYPQGGAPIVKDPITVAANSRATVFVNSDAGEGLSICAGIASDQPVIVERPMYFDFDGIWDGGTDVVGYQP